MGGAANVGLQGFIERYDTYGPFVTSFVTNFLATFGDKGQIAVITLATTYDAKKVFFGAVTAFALWNAVEVAVGSALVALVPAGVMPALTGGLFVVFGIWSGLQALRVARNAATTNGGLVQSILPESVFDRLHGRGAFAISFLMIAFAEVGDKTQLLTINLAAAFPHSPVHVFFGAFLGLALRTGIDAFIGEAAERHLPTFHIQTGAAAIFLAVGFFQFGVLEGVAVVAVALGAIAFAVVGALERAYSRSP